MAKYSKSSTVGGKWAKAAEIENGTTAKIVSETVPQASSFTNKDGSPKTQDVCKVQFVGVDEPLNVSLNRATINALVDAFGEDSIKWQGHTLSVETEKMRVAGKVVHALYLIPKGYARIDDENGYALIIKKSEVKKAKQVDLDDEEEESVDLDEE
jgi:hypothetical protein